MASPPPPPPKGNETRAILCGVSVFVANFGLRVIFQLRETENIQKLSSKTFLLQGGFLQITQVLRS